VNNIVKPRHDRRPPRIGEFLTTLRKMSVRRGGTLNAVALYVRTRAGSMNRRWLGVGAGEEDLGDAVLLQGGDSLRG